VEQNFLVVTRFGDAAPADFDAVARRHDDVNYAQFLQFLQHAAGFFNPSRFRFGKQRLPRVPFSLRRLLDAQPTGFIETFQIRRPSANDLRHKNYQDNFELTHFST